MNKYIEKLISLLLVVLILLLAFNHFNVIQFSEVLRHSFSFITFILVIISSFSVINGRKPVAYKVVNYIILISAIIGGIYAIINSKLNISIYICLLFSIAYAIVDMLYKRA